MNHKSSKTEALSNANTILVVIIIAGIILSFSVFFIIRHEQRSAFSANFTRDATDRFSAIEVSIDKSIEELEAIELFFNRLGMVKKDYFNSIAGHILADNLSIYDLQWLPLVRGRDRARFEHDADRDLLKGFRITQRDAQGKMVRAAVRDEYFPVYFIESLNVHEAVVGFDIASNPARLAALNKARVNGVMTATSRIELLHEKEGEIGFLILVPIYKKDTPTGSPLEREKNIEGFVLSTFKVSDIVNTSFKALTPKGLDVEIFDVDSASGNELLYSYKSRLRKDMDTLDKGEDKAHEIAYDLKVAGRTWSVRVSAHDSYFFHINPWVSWLLLFAALALTTFISVMFSRVLVHAREAMRTGIVLADEIEERKLAEVQIRETLKEKEVLLKEVHHRVKNNLQVVSSILNIQAGYIEDMMLKSIFKESQERIRSMSLVHEQLYQSKNLSSISLPVYIKALVMNIFNSYTEVSSRVSLKIDIEDTGLNIDTAISLGLILNELCTNIFKYAFPEMRDGELCIDFAHLGDGSCRLTISDNGVGMPEGFDIEMTNSMGFFLVRSMVDQIDGSLEIDQSSGMSFTIIFSDSPKN